MLFKKPAHRVFDYTPRYFDPEKDERAKRKRKLKFRSSRHFTRKKRTSIYWFILILIVLFFIIRFQYGG